MTIYGIIVGISTAITINHINNKYPEKLKIQDYIFTLFMAIIGGRLLYVVRYPEQYSQLAEIIAIDQGGMRIYGVLFGVLIAAAIISKIRNIKFFELGDTLVGILPLSQAFGRIANFINQELYGYPTDTFLGVFIKPHNRISGYENFTHFHPVFFYEAFLNLLLWIAINKLFERNSKIKKGTKLAIYLLGYGLIRVVTNRFRLDLLTDVLIEPSDLFSIIFICVGIGLLIVNNFCPKCLKFRPKSNIISS